MDEPPRCAPPRLSEATRLLPALRARLIGAAMSSGGLPASVELLPIVDDGLFGYELVPDRHAPAYVIIGRAGDGVPVVRITSYGSGAPDALRLAAVNGRLLSWRAVAARHRARRRDERPPDWSAAAQRALLELDRLFPHAVRDTFEIGESHAGLEQALARAHARLAQWDPLVHFFGVPNEAQMGFALTTAGIERGKLVGDAQGAWTLLWDSASAALRESTAAIRPGPPRRRGSDAGAIHLVERRVHERRRDAGTGIDLQGERRRTPGRRAMDHASP